MGRSTRTPFCRYPRKMNRARGGGPGRVSPAGLRERCRRGWLAAIAGMLPWVSAEAPCCGEESEAAPPEEAAPVASRDHLVPDWGGKRSGLEDKGWTFAVSYTGETLGVVHGGVERGAIYEGLVAAQAGFDTGKAGLWPGGTLHGSMLYPHGNSLTERKLGDLFTFSNLDAPDDPRLFELWYEHAVWSGRVSLRLGQLGADQEFAGTDLGAAFINGTCGWPAMIGANVPSPAYPAATPGARLAVDLGGGWLFRVAGFNGTPCPVNANGESLDPNGVRFHVHDAFLIAETVKEWHAGDDARGLPGRARLGGWYHTGDFDDARIDDAGVCLADPASSGTPARHGGNRGIYASVEQQLTREPLAADAAQGLGAFARVGGSPSDRNTVECYLESGLTYTGLLPGRDQDVCGFAAVYGQISRRIRQAEADRQRFGAPSAPGSDYEMVLEATYRMAMAPGVSVQPVVALLLHPGGSTAINDALVLGLRGSVEF